MIKYEGHILTKLGERGLREISRPEVLQTAHVHENRTDMCMCVKVYEGTLQSRLDR